MNIEILRIHEDYITTPILYRNITEWLVGPGATKFSKPIDEKSKEELNVFLVGFSTSARKKDDTLSVDMSSSMKSI